MERTDTSSPTYLASSADSSDRSSFTYSIKRNLFVMTFSWCLWPREKRLHPLGSALSRVSIPALPGKTSRQQTRSCFSVDSKTHHTPHPAPSSTLIVLPFPKGLRKAKRSDWPPSAPPPPTKNHQTKKRQGRGNAVQCSTSSFYEDQHICNSHLVLQPP